MPRKVRVDPEETSKIEEYILAAFDKTTIEDREWISQAWCLNYAVDLSEYVEKTGIPPIALKIASLIWTSHPLLTSPGRGVMYSAMGCWIVVGAIEITEVALNSPECMEVIAKVLRKKLPKPLRAKRARKSIPRPV